METKYYTLDEVSKLLRTPIPRLRILIKEHKLKGLYIGRHYIISESDLKQYIKSLGVKNER